MFQRPLTDGVVDEEQEHDFAASARSFLGDLGNILGRYRFGEVRPVSIASLVKVRLLAGRKKGTVTSDITTPFYILAWEGARNEILIPMLAEIRFNAEKALLTLPEEDQIYGVSLKKGTGDEVDFGILEIANSYEDARPSSLSTGYGEKIIQRLAESIGGGAVRTKVEIDNRKTFIWKIYLPLWKGTLV